MNKKNILHLISSLEVGGAEKLLIDLLKNTDSQNVNFTVIVMNDNVNEELKRELIETNYNVYFLNRKQSSKNPKYILKLLNIIKKHQIRIIHSHNYGSKSWSILCKLFNPKIKLIFTIHDTNIFMNLNNLQIFSHKTFIDMNIAISKAVLKDAHKHSILKTIQIYNGINIKDFMSKEKNKKVGDILNIINVSRVNHVKKGQDVLIKALKICKDNGLKFRCDFVGGVYEYSKNSYQYLNTLTKELELEDEINFLGNRNDICKLLSQSDLFVLPSRYEGLGLVVLEAMATSTPVIVSNIDGPAELVTSGENGLLFESENHIDLADKIMELHNNEEKREALAKRAHDFIQDFDITNMCYKYNKVYMTLTDAD